MASSQQPTAAVMSSWLSECLYYISPIPEASLWTPVFRTSIAPLPATKCAALPGGTGCTGGG